MGAVALRAFGGTFSGPVGLGVIRTWHVDAGRLTADISGVAFLQAFRLCGERWGGRSRSNTSAAAVGISRVLCGDQGNEAEGGKSSEETHSDVKSQVHGCKDVDFDRKSESCAGRGRKDWVMLVTKRM